MVVSSTYKSNSVQIEIGREGLRDFAVAIPLNGKAARLVLPWDAVEVQQVGENFFAWMRERLARQRHFIRRNNAVLGKPQTATKLKLRFRGGRKIAALDQAGGMRRVHNQVGDVLGIELFGVQNQIEQMRRQTGLLQTAACARRVDALPAARIAWRAAERSRRSSSMMLPTRTESGATMCTRSIPGNCLKSSSRPSPHMTR